MVAGAQRQHRISVCACCYARAGVRQGDRCRTARCDTVLFDPGVDCIAAGNSHFPIVFVGVADPIGSALIESLARPGGNLTGLMMYDASVRGKWLSMLKEIAPNLKRAALLIEEHRAGS